MKLHGLVTREASLITSIRVLGLLLFLTVVTAVQGQFIVATNDDGTLTITAYNSRDQNVNVPSIIDGRTVTCIGDCSFGCRELTNVTLPNTITKIGNSAFSATYLTNITIPDGVTNIGTSAFACCPLVSVSISSSAAIIGNGAFSYCSLTSVTIPSSVTVLGNRAFSYCRNLTNATIHGSITNLGGGIFEGCAKMSALTVDAANPCYSSIDGILFNKNSDKLIQCPAGKTGSIRVPESVTSIENNAFLGCSLTNITIPRGVTNIGMGAFYNCTRLTRLYFEGNAPFFGQDALQPVPGTIYYFPNTAGWDTALVSCPTVLWNPQLSIVNHNSRAVNFRVDGTANIPFVLETCTNLANPAWVTRQAGFLEHGFLSFLDVPSTGTHFYRIRSP